jgi:peptidyl-prolyl cis-trans isomerase D
MIAFFRRVTKSKIGLGILAAAMLAIVIGFAAADLSNFGTGMSGLTGMSSTTLARVGDQEVSEREMSEFMQKRLQAAREQNPDADYASIVGDFDKVLSELIDAKTLIAFADKFGLNLSKRLIDAEIANLPGVKGLNGQFSDAAYQQFLARQRLTDAELRELIASGKLQQLVLTPVAINPRIPVGVAKPYAAMMLEARQGDGIAIPLDPFKAGLKPTDAEIGQFYAANKTRYMIPEQRVLRLAKVGPEQVANVTASDQEITAYYNANQATYGASEKRNLSQVVVPDQNTANAIAAKAKAGTALAAAAAPAGAKAAVTTLADQTRQAYASVAGDKVAGAVFAAGAGAVVGPVQSDFGWVVVKVDGVKKVAGKTLAQARAEIAAKLNADKRKAALEDLVAKVQDALDGGSNLLEAAAAAKVQVTSTPLIMANGASRSDPNYKLPPELAPALKNGFDLTPSDEPEVVTLPNDQGYAFVSPAQIVPAAPASLASVKEQVAADWVNDQARQRAATVATTIAAKASGGMSLADAVKQAGLSLPPVQPISGRFIQIAAANGPVPAPLRLLFSLGQGKAKMAPDPGGRGFYVVKTNTITPGNPYAATNLITGMQQRLRGDVADEFGREFMEAVKAELKAKRNESAIAAQKARMASSGS